MPIQTAKEIINQSIRNFVCIDDDYSMPFQSDPNEFSLNMYNAFHQEYKNIKILKYKPESNVHDVTPYFVNADIVILDWKLAPHGIETTLSILRQAILTDHVKYIFIYTNDKVEGDTAGLEDLRQALLLSMYSDLDSENLFEDLKDLIINEYDLEEEDLEKYIGNIEEFLSDFIRLKISPKQLRQQLFSKLKEIDETIEQKDICKNLSDLGVSTKLFSILLKNMRDQLLGPLEVYSNIDFEIKDLNDDVYIANDKLIKVVSKSDMEPNTLVTYIHDFMALENDSFFSILSHEILDRFKRTFLIRTKMYANIDNNIIKKYVDFKDSSEEKMSLKELIEGIYNDTFMSVLKNQDLLFMNKAPEFFDAMQDGINTDIKMEIKRINSFISIDHTKEQLPSHRNRMQIEFGDIFSVEEIGKELKYAICITPHCDCAHPTNEQVYKFAFSHNITSNFELDNTNFDSDYCSFLPLDNTIIKIVDWKPRSSTNDTYIKTTSLVIVSDNNINDEMTVKALPHKEYKFKFVAQQKESFTQRLVNESARHSIRVGVSFLNTRQNTHCEVQNQ